MDKIQEECSSCSLLLNFSCHINLHMASTYLLSAIYVRRHQKKKYHIVRSDDVVTNVAARHYRFDQSDVDHDDDDKGDVDAKAKDDDHEEEVSKICTQRFNHYMDQIISLVITLWSCSIVTHICM